MTADDVKNSVQFVLTQSRIRVITSASTYLYVNVDILDTCSAADISVEVKTPVMILSSKRFDFGTVWDDGTLLGGISDMQSRVMESVERLTKKLVVDWSSANP